MSDTSAQTTMPKAGVAGQTAFLAEHKRRPTARRDGMAAWLRDEIEYLEQIALTEYGEGSLSAYRAALKELETIDA